MPYFSDLNLSQGWGRVGDNRWLAGALLAYFNLLNSHRLSVLYQLKPNKDRKLKLSRVNNSFCISS